MNKNKRVYISFPMKGKSVEDYMEQELCAFKRLESYGLQPISPIRDKLFLSCDAIYLCEGWEYSHDCMNELQVAADCRLKVLTSEMTDSRIKKLMGVNK